MLAPHGLHFRFLHLRPPQHCVTRAHAAPRPRHTLQRLGLPCGPSHTLLAGAQHWDWLAHTRFRPRHGGGGFVGAFVGTVAPE
jgi:hypothetical protein